ncbi:MAG TPA: hypothetical protein VFN09_10680, partial [Rhodanobacteraceae bacterium]|nr:hypothetical protein [Rhodanobacteraceae bacterium]
MRMAGGKFKFYGTFSLLAAALLGLGGCASAPVRDAQTVPAQPLARLLVDADGPATQAMTHALAGEFALVDGNLPAANRAYAAAAAQSNDPRVAERSAQLALAQDDRPGAAAAIARMQASGADAKALLRERARLALLQGQREQALADLRQLLAPGDHEAWREVARLLAQARDPAAAGTLLEQLATPASLPAKDPSMWVAMSQLGEKLQRHRYAESLADAAAARFDDATVLAWAAHLKLQKDDTKTAADLYRRAVALQPKAIRLRLGYAAVLSQQGANKVAAAMLADGPQDFQTYAARAAYLARAEDMGGMRQVYKQLAAAAPTLDVNASFLLGQLADADKKPAAAIGWYAKVPLDDEHYFEANARRAVLLSRQGSGGIAAAHALVAQLVHESQGDDKQLLQALLLDAQIYTGNGDTAGAIAAYGRGLAQLPQSAELLYGRALSLADAGKTAASITDLRAVLKLQPDDIDAANALGYTLAD